MAPVRLLCVHGYRQNSASFRDKTGAFRKQLKNQAELLYVSAPHCVQQEGGTKNTINEAQEEDVLEARPGGDDDPRGWWFSDIYARSFSAQQQCELSLGIDESVNIVREAVKVQGPFDGILGFSQGAAFVAMLCSLQEQNLVPEFCFRFAIIVAGFRSACQEHQKFYSVPLKIPSLHVFGLTDRVIPDSMSRELLPCFQDPQVVTHPGGHFIPATSAFKQNYLDFITRFH